MDLVLIKDQVRQTSFYSTTGVVSHSCKGIDITNVPSKCKTLCDLGASSSRSQNATKNTVSTATSIYELFSHVLLCLITKIPHADIKLMMRDI